LTTYFEIKLKKTIAFELLLQGLCVVFRGRGIGLEDSLSDGN